VASGVPLNSTPARPPPRWCASGVSWCSRLHALCRARPTRSALLPSGLHFAIRAARARLRNFHADRDGSKGAERCGESEAPMKMKKLAPFFLMGSLFAVALVASNCEGELPEDGVTKVTGALITRSAIMRDVNGRQVGTVTFEETPQG